MHGAEMGPSAPDLMLACFPPGITILTYTFLHFFLSVLLLICTILYYYYNKWTSFVRQFVTNAPISFCPSYSFLVTSATLPFLEY